MDEGDFWAKVQLGDGCWEWKGSRYPGGYGRVRMALPDRGSFTMAHRVAYALKVGRIPDGLVLDHLCRNKGCVNPSHLEPVTFRENLMRGTSPPANNLVKTHCKRGHEFTEENTYRPKNYPSGRQCRACWKLSKERRHQRKSSGSSVGGQSWLTMVMVSTLTPGAPGWTDQPAGANQPGEPPSGDQ